MSLFSIKIFNIHVLTLVLLVVCFILTYWKVKVNFVHRITIAGIVTMLGLWFYELIWLIGIYNGNINFPELFITIFFIQILLIYNYVFKFRFLHLSKIFIILLILFFTVMFGMVTTGWFAQFNLWAVDQTLPDPHNWLWGASKIVGLLMWSFLVRQRSEDKNTL